VTHIWITFMAPKDCLCWRDAVCSHGFTWQEDEDAPCDHYESYLPAHYSLADAVRSLFWIGGHEAMGLLLRQRVRSKERVRTVAVFVMPAGVGPFVDDHDADEGPAPLYVLKREQLMGRSTPRADVDEIRTISAQYR